MTLADQSLADQLIGTWRLRSWESTSPDGEARLPLGPAPEGLLVYSPDGTMLTCMARGGRTPFASPDLLGGTDGEKILAVDSFVAYGGAWRVEDGDVIHTVEASLFPNWVGSQQRRHVQLAGDGGSLTLVAPPVVMGGVVRINRVGWTRVRR
jgi:hypothetical protein